MWCPLLSQQEREKQSFWASVNSKWIEVSEASALQPGIQPLGKRSFFLQGKSWTHPCNQTHPELESKTPQLNPDCPDQALDSNPALPQQGYQPLARRINGVSQIFVFKATILIRTAPQLPRLATAPPRGRVLEIDLTAEKWLCQVFWAKQKLQFDVTAGLRHTLVKDSISTAWQRSTLPSFLILFAHAKWKVI